MNERIKLLALEAKFGAAILLHHYGTVDYLCDSEQEELEQIEKFAELIIKECSNHALDFNNNVQALSDKVMRCNLARVSDYVKDRMGVEE